MSPIALLLGFIVACLMACVVASIAHLKGRSAFGWWFYGFVFWPLALIHAGVMAPTKRAEEDALERDGLLRKCPECAERIQSDARKCRYCGAAIAT